MVIDPAEGETVPPEPCNVPSACYTQYQAGLGVARLSFNLSLVMSCIRT